MCINLSLSIMFTVSRPQVSELLLMDKKWQHAGSHHWFSFFFLSSFSASTNLASHLKSRDHKSGKYLHMVPAFSIWFKPIDFSYSSGIKKQTLKSGIVSGLILFPCIKSCFFKCSMQLLYFKIHTSLILWPLQLVSMFSISHAFYCCCWLCLSSCTGCSQWSRPLEMAIITPTIDIGGSSLHWLCILVYLHCRSHCSYYRTGLDCSSWARKCSWHPLASSVRLVIHFGSQIIAILLPTLTRIFQDNLHKLTEALNEKPSCELDWTYHLGSLYSVFPIYSIKIYYILFLFWVLLRELISLFDQFCMVHFIENLLIFWRTSNINAVSKERCALASLKCRRKWFVHVPLTSHFCWWGEDMSPGVCPNSLYLKKL